MKGKIAFLLVATVLIFALGIQMGESREKKEATLDTTKVMRKLDEVLANQAKIFRQFAEIKQEFAEIRHELTIIKIRASK